MESTNTNWSKTTRYIAGMGLALFGILILYISRSVIPLLIIAGLVAILVRPAISWLHIKVRMSLGLSVTVVYLILAILLPLAIFLAMPAILNTINFISNLDYQAIFQNVIAWFRSTLIAIKTLSLPLENLNQYFEQTADILLNSLDKAAIAQPAPTSADTILQSLTMMLSTAFHTAADLVASISSHVALLVFSFLASVYISLSAHTFHDAFLRTVPDRFRSEIATLIANIERTWKAFFRGELTLMLFIGVISWLGLTVLGIHSAPYLGIIAGLLEIVPNIGPVLSAIPAVIVALLQGSIYIHVSPLFMALIVILFYILVQQVENSFIVPNVLGKAVNLPALVVMTGVLVGAEVGGLLGVLLATPVIATIRDIVSYIYRKILGENPFPSEEEAQTSGAHPPNKTLQLLKERFVQLGGFRKVHPETLPNNRMNVGPNRKTSSRLSWSRGRGQHARMTLS